MTLGYTCGSPCSPIHLYRNTSKIKISHISSSGPLIIYSQAFLICHLLEDHAMLLQYCVVLHVQDVNKQTNRVNDYLTSPAAMWLYPEFIKPSENTQMWRERQPESWSKDTTEKTQIPYAPHKNNKKNMQLVTCEKAMHSFSRVWTPLSAKVFSSSCINECPQTSMN